MGGNYMNEIVKKMKMINDDEHNAIIDYLMKYDFNYSRRELTSEEEEGSSINQSWRY